MKLKLSLAAGVMLTASLGFSQAKLVDQVKPGSASIVIPYSKYELPNGLTLIVHEDHSDPVVHVDVTYHVGSAREQIGKSGFAHFFEHMMFQGSDHVADEQHFKIVSEAGGDLNGSTNRDRTNYYETVPSNQLEKALWLEADRMGFLLDAVTQQKFEIQRSTVKNERGQRYDNVQYGLAGETTGRTLYPYGHPYSWSTIGYLEDLNRSNVNDLKNFFLRWYGPNNATLTIGGDVKTTEVLKLVEKYFGSIPRGPEVSAQQYAPVSLAANRYVSYIDNYARQPLLSITYPTAPDYSKDMAALDCLSELLGQGRNSALYQQLVKTQQAFNASAFNYQTELAGELSIRVIPVPGKTLAEMEAGVKSAFESFEKKGVSAEDIARFRGSSEARIINRLQSVQGKVSQLADFETFTGSPNKIADILKSYQQLTAADVMAAYNKYIKNKGAVVLSVLPKGQESTIAHADNFVLDTTGYKAPDYGYNGLKYVKAKDNFDRNKMPASGANPQITLPTVWKKTLTNGAIVMGTRNAEVPVVTMSITVPGGHLTAANDHSKAGLASLFASMMTEDTKTHTAEQLSNELQKLGATIRVGSTLDGITYSVQALKGNYRQVLQILEERLMQPQFTQAAFDRIQRQTLQALKAQKGQPAAIASNVFDKLNYGADNILAISQNGTEETVKNLTLKDVQDYYDQYLTSVGTKVVVVGDINETEALSSLAFLDKLPRKKITLPKPTAAPAVAGTKVYIVDVPKGAQTEFRMGYATGTPYDATGKYYRSLLSNYALGSGFNSRLNLNLREDKGWTYGASSGFRGDEYGGVYAFNSGIRADATDSALAEIMKDVRNYTQNGPTDAEVAFMKSAIGQADALRFETGVQRAAFIKRMMDYNLPATYIQEQSKIMNGMTAAQLKQIAASEIRPDKMNILLVGDKALFIDKIKAMGYEVVELDADGKVVDKKAF